MKTIPCNFGPVALSVVIALAVTVRDTRAAQPEKRPVQVFILAGQSNMEGAGVIKMDPDRNGGKGTLEYMVRDPAMAGRVAHMVNADGTWVIRPDVWIWYFDRKGGLTAGYGARETMIGPEFGFGHAMGEALDEQVLLIKTAWGGKSLAKDFRPPSSGGDVGPYYTEMLHHVRGVLSDIKAHFPTYDGRGYTLAGFGWHQGWNDRVNQASNDAYEQNMANFIRDVRKDLGVEELPFVIAETGMSGHEEKHPRALSLMRAQAAVAERAEFKGNVAFVGTKDFYRPKEASPSGQAYHWNNNAETYFLIGVGMARAMLGLLKDPGDGTRGERGGEGPAPIRGLEEVAHGQVKLDGGFWGERLRTHHAVTIPHALNCLEKAGHVTNFDKAAGTFGGPLQGHHAFDSDLHKALEGTFCILQHFDDPDLKQRANGILDRILAAQQEDGFLISCYIVKDSDKRWENLRLEHQLYNAGHFFEMAVEHHRLTGQAKALDAARRFADHIDGTFGPGKRYDVGGHEEVELALVKLYRTTGERRYLELSRFFLDERGHAHGLTRSSFDPDSIPKELPSFEHLPQDERRRAQRRARNSVRNGRMQDHKPLVEQDAIGHAVRAGYVYSAMTDMARFMDAPDYDRAVRRIWQDVVGRKMYITGGIGTAQYHDEGFGDPYLLPNRTYCESCAGIAHVLWQHRMAMLTGQTRYADVMELALYNAAISGIALAGNAFFYQNPLASKGGRRSSWIGLACCPTNLSRIIPQVGGLAYARRDNDIYVNLYLAGEVSFKVADGVTVTLAQQTDYPRSGRVHMTITPDRPSSFALCLRLPGWALARPVPSDLYRFGDSKAEPVDLKVNGRTADDAGPADDGYVRLQRLWRAGDEVDLTLPMPVRRVYAHDKVEEDRGKVALMRGPLVYCLEAVDHAGADVSTVSLPRDAELSTQERPELLGGVTVLRAAGNDDDKQKVSLTAVPYYAWANREAGAMTVWIKEE